MLDGKNFDCVAEIVEADTVSTDAQAELRRFDVLKPFDVAFFGLNEARQAVEDPHCGLLLDRANINLGRIGPSDLFGHR